MKMGKIEKWLMNTSHHAETVIQCAEKLLHLGGMSNVCFMDADATTHSYEGFYQRKG